MADLGGRRVVVLEGRMPSELASLVTRHGGEPIIAPALREVPLPMRQDVQDIVDSICSRTMEAAVFLTGVGARALINAADELGRKDEFLAALHDTKIICRGPKPVAVMRQNSIPIALIAPEPFMSEDLVAAIKAEGWDFRGKRVALQHYGEINAYLRGELIAMGAEVMEASLYAWELPEDTGPVVNAIRRIVARDVDAVMFTTQSQIRNLMRIADDNSLSGDLKNALTAVDIVVASVGPVCSRALREHGITPDVEPQHPKMGPLVIELANHFAAGEPEPAGSVSASGS